MPTKTDLASSQTFTFTEHVNDLRLILEAARVAWYSKWPSATVPLGVFNDPERGTTFIFAADTYMSVARVLISDPPARFWDLPAQFWGAIWPHQVESAISQARSLRCSRITWRLTRDGDNVTANTLVYGRRLGEPAVALCLQDHARECFARQYDRLGAVSLRDLAGAFQALRLPDLTANEEVGVKLTFDDSELRLESETGQTASLPATVDAKSTVRIEGCRFEAALRVIGRRGKAVFSAWARGGPDVDKAGVAHYPGVTRMDVQSRGFTLQASPYVR